MRKVTDIELRLRQLSQLFNELDPSPLVERDLSDDVESFIFEWATEAERGSRYRLVIHAPAATHGAFSSESVADAIGNYFGYMAERERIRNSRLLRDGRSALATGLVFLLLCTLASRAISASIPGTIGAAIAEGLVILGWVANWRPIEIFLYDWRPARRRATIYQALSEMEVVLADEHGESTGVPPAS
jgi:hypothetical protein